MVAKYPAYRESTEQAIQLMGPQTVAHLVIIFFIVLGNVAYFLERRARKREGR